MCGVVTCITGPPCLGGRIALRPCRWFRCRGPLAPGFFGLFRGRGRRPPSSSPSGVGVGAAPPPHYWEGVVIREVACFGWGAYFGCSLRCLLLGLFVFAFVFVFVFVSFLLFVFVLYLYFCVRVCVCVYVCVCESVCVFDKRRDPSCGRA